ncbi:major capsid protein P2 [Shewanella gelidii]|uniref:Viral coat protein P2 N-terminal domain-containing protein n=1 Tax=Shewanella gelidii TaxID=1642821 RepID=A0A917JVM4_9GAMM|nr:major capsid protein P2 [Shewanella gelidii]MCL1098068.1 major capsid protein P2 [Shewanella gelidii]GGI85900.1 hypothetical protein GCM10009332_24010 [Shewanella gelidii]
MARSTKKINTISAVVKGNLCTVTLPLGKSYDHLMIEYSGVTLAQLKNIRIKINEDVIQEFKDGNALKEFNAYYKRELTDGILDIHFKQPEMKTLAEQRMFSLGTANGIPQTPEQVALMPAVQAASVTFEIDAGATAPVIACSAQQSDPAPLGNIVKVKRYPIVLQPGTNEFDHLPKGVDSRIKAVHVVSAAVVEKIMPVIDESEQNDLSQTLIKKLQRAHNRTPQANFATIDFTMEGDMKQSIPLKAVRDLRFRVECAADTTPSTSAELLVEYIDTLKGA